MATENEAVLSQLRLDTEDLPNLGIAVLTFFGRFPADHDNGDIVLASFLHPERQSVIFLHLGHQGQEPEKARVGICVTNIRCE